jgi:hypothetical protein
MRERDDMAKIVVGESGPVEEDRDDRAITVVLVAFDGPAEPPDASDSPLDVRSIGRGLDVMGVRVRRTT